MTDRWNLPSREVMAEALDLIAKMQKHEQLTLLQHENKNLKYQIEIYKKAIKNLTTKQKEE